MSRLEQLETQLLAHFDDDSMWRVYADALAEADRLPEALAHALSGGPVPEVSFVGYLQHHLKSQELELTFNRFHYIESAVVRPQTYAGYELIVLDLLDCPLSRFLKDLRVTAFTGGTEDCPQQVSAVRRGFERANANLPRFTTLNLGYSTAAIDSYLMPSLLSVVHRYAPRLETTLTTVVQVFREVRLRVISCAPDLQVANIAVGELLAVEDHDFSRALQPTADNVVQHLMQSDRPLKGDCSLRVMATPGNVGLRVTKGTVLLRGRELDSNTYNVDLSPGDTIDIGPGLVLQAEGH